MKIVMLGSGNAATVLCELIYKAGFEIAQVVSREFDHARDLANKYNTLAGTISDTTFQEADFYIVALHDAALDHIEKIPALKDKMVIHISGAISINALKECSTTYGVMYPLQTLSKFADEIPEIPFLVDGNTQEVKHRILGLAKSLSGNVIEANDTERLNYHIAAVFAGNFTNHLYAMADLFCQKERLEFRTLHPLMKEVFGRSIKYSPFLTQTGPAIRDDVYTLNKHLQALASHPDYKYIYLKLTESIIKLHGKR
ncbi:MAG: DUF2520 domain-containing protein [Bacteroidetes bacterium]|nr:DUF2520 domain-containing protein [Bacteroidota bacterium]